MEYQVTLFNAEGRYKPVSCIIYAEGLSLDNEEQKKQILNKGIAKICQKRLWKTKDLKKYGYTKAKVRRKPL